MRAVWKFQLDVLDQQKVEMPKDASIIHLEAQGQKPCLWALVDPEQEKEERLFHMFGTGHVLDDDIEGLDYIGTFQILNGSFVGHIFEKETNGK